jgi:isoquinoline 1-oxidoreductase beta subunit
MDANLTRRSFLTVSATLAGGLLIRISPLEAAPAPRAEQLGVFVRIDPAGPITIGARAPEIGQGVKTALPMLIAEELDVDWSEVVVEQLPYGAIPADNALGFDSKYGPQQAGGSTNVKYGWTPLRQAGAKVRRMLVDAAAEAWGVGAGTVRTEAGRLIHPETGARHRYGEFASAAAKREVPAEEQPLKSPDQFRIIGTASTARSRAWSSLRSPTAPSSRATSLPSTTPQHARFRVCSTSSASLPRRTASAATA